ncbi:MAG: hypothetical protein R2940_02650 [Syntrophotaleaceae bacterium]
MNVDEGDSMPENSLSPFGNPEGARADLEEVARGFVDFGDHLVWKGLATKPNDLRARVFVGKKGSGKTLYLRRAHDFVAAQQDNLYAGSINDNAPLTQEIIRISRFFKKHELRETWCQLWRKAIIRSAVSHIINNEILVSQVGDKLCCSFRSNYSEILYDTEETRYPSGIFDELGSILQKNFTRNSILKYVTNTKWGQLETEVAIALKKCKPVCLYMDGIDDHFQHAPMYWLECQIGLFNAIMSLLRDQNLGGRLHVTVAIRDVVRLKILQTEHNLRNFEEEHIRVLKWDVRSISYLLSEKVKKLNNELFHSYDGSKSINSWLGLSEFENKKRNKKEKIESYLLRHTRLLPRDVVTMGNVLCQELQRLKWFPEVYTLPEAIKRGVSFAAREFGKEQLQICGTHLATDMSPTKFEHKDYEKFLGTDEYKANLADKIKAYISSFKKDRFTRSVLLRQEELAKEYFDEGSDIINVLWLNGMLGYADSSDNSGIVVFYSDDGGPEFKLPRDKKEYAFHSCLIDATGIQPSGNPVLQQGVIL